MEAQREEARRGYAEAARAATDGRAATDRGTENCVHTDGARGWAMVVYEDDAVEQMPRVAEFASHS